MDNLKDKKILIAGGTGFIGRRTAAFLAEQGAKVYVLTRRIIKPEGNIVYYQADLNDIDSLREYLDQQFDACVYMAANIPEVGQKKETYLDAKKSTLDPLVNFCEAYIGNAASFVYISSIDVLGGCSVYEYDENATINTATPYGLAKYSGEFYTACYCNQAKIPYTILRFSQVYGPNEPIVRVIPILKNALHNGKDFSLYSDGTEKRRFLFVDDAVQAIVCALKAEKTGVYNIAGNDICTIKTLIDTMERIYGVKLNLTILNKANGQSNIPSIEKAVNELGYHPKYSLKEGLNIIKMEEGRND